MSFKDLELNRSLIEEAINNFDEKLQIESNNEKTKFIAFYNGQPRATINFFYKKNGKTTIQTTQGSNIELGTTIANEVVSQCQIAIASKGNFSIKPLTQENFDLLIEYLSEECDATVTKKHIQHGKQFNVTGVQGDSVYLNYYNNKTLSIQGCPVLLHSQIVDFLCEFLELQDIVNSQLKIIKTDITATEALNDLETYLPNSYSSLDDKLKAILSPSLVLKKLDIELTDYSAFAFPALKGLEGYIKVLFSSKGIIIGKSGFGDYLREDNHSTLNTDARQRLGCEKTCTSINKCYAYYRSHRHGLFHANGIIKSTRLIEKNLMRYLLSTMYWI